MRSNLFQKLVLLAAFLHVSLASGLYARTAVREVNAKTFRQQVLDNGNVTVVEFYAPWCGHCKNLKPEYVKSARMLKGLVNVAAVNCDDPANKGLCAHYKIQGFPTIKVFQPAKLTDVDFKDVVEGKELPVRKGKVFNYTGPRDAKSINKFAIGKLRNYAASLVNEMAISWLKPNRIPRIVMLPGKKYKSKSIAPLFKVLSREYFGKMRFAYVPRRVDGAWSLLGLAAPEESQLVYMSDDKEPLVYQGAMNKKAIKRFLDEQYAIELDRRIHKGVPLQPERDEAANGLEWILEDAQDTEMEHMIKIREEREREEALFEAAASSARHRLGKDAPEPTGSATSATASTTSTTTTAEPRPTTVDPDEDDAEDFTYSGDATETPVAEDELEFEHDSGSAGIDHGDEAEGNEPEEVPEEDTEAILDEIEIDLAPEDIVEEGPEAVSSYLAKISAERESMMKHMPSKTSAAAEPGVTKEAKPYEDLASIDSIVSNCFRGGKPCVLLSTPNEDFKQNDVIVLMRALERIPSKAKTGIYFQLIVDDDNEELEQFTSDLGIRPYKKMRRDAHGESKHMPSVMYFDLKRRTYSVMEDDYTAVEVAKFVVSNVNRQHETQKIPEKYVFWVTADDVERMDAAASAKAAAEAAEAEGVEHDEL